MALKLVNQAGNALGQFDGYDNQINNFLGGEVVTFASLPLSSTDLAAADVFDGYTNQYSTAKRTVVTYNLIDTSRPLMLSDDGVAGYGTLFGSVVGGTVGKVTSGAVLGPSTATGSGKITCWHLPGVYAVSLDAVDQGVGTPTDGLLPTNTNISTGEPLTYTSVGKLTPFNSTNAVGGAPVVGTLIDFETNGSLVTTPNYLVSALNSPFGYTPGPRQFSYAVFYFNPPVA
jgi:hypothetical protein